MSSSPSTRPDGFVRRRPRLRGCRLLPGIILAASAIAAPSHAEARSETVRFAIPAGPLNHALLLFADQSGMQILFTPDIVAGRTARPIAGRHPPAKALKRMLEGTGLAVRILASGAMMIVPGHGGVPAAPIPPPLPAPAARPVEAEPIMVTAFKYPSLLSESPAGLTVTGAAELERRGVVDLAGLARTMPSLLASDTASGASRLTVRGVYGRGEPTVGVYFGESPVSGPSGTTFDPGWMAPDLEMVDLERIELLRGPQGTLYGASSMGGTLRVLFRQPDLTRTGADITGGLSWTQGGAPGSDLSATVNLPLREGSLALRATAYRRRIGGYIDHPPFGITDAGRTTREGGRVLLAWEPAPGARLTLGLVDQVTRVFDATFRDDPSTYRNRLPIVADNRNRLRLGNALLEWDIGRVSLTATGTLYGWRAVKQGDFTDVLAGQVDSPAACQRFSGLAADTPCSAGQQDVYRDFALSRLPAILHQPMRVRSANAELRLHSATAAMAWTAGVFVERRRDRVDSYVASADPATGRLVDPLDVTGLRYIWTGLDQRALFGEVTRNLSPRLSATAGVRYFSYDRTASGTIAVANVITGTADIAEGRFATHESGTNLKFQLAWQQSPDLLVYALAAGGYRPGGVNVTPSLTDAERSYRADSLWSYEAGARFSLPAAHLSGEAAVYHIDWSDMIYSANSANSAFAYNTNVGDVDITGIEAGADFASPSGLTAALRLSWVDARLAENQRWPGALGQGLAGDRLPSVPDLSLGTSLSWRTVFTAGRAAGLAARLGVDALTTTSSASQFNPGVSGYARTPARTIIDASATLGGERWELLLSLRNVLNSASPDRVLVTATGQHQYYGAAPRTMTVQLRMHL